MKQPLAGNDAAAITIASVWSRAEAISFVLLGGAVVVVVPFDRQDGPQWVRHISRPVPVIFAYLVVAGLALAWLLYRGGRLGVRFDDHGVTVRKLLRTDRYSWAEVSHFADGYGQSSGGTFWALDIVLSDGRAVTVRPGTLGASARPKALTAIRQVAARYQIPAELTGAPRRSVDST